MKFGLLIAFLVFAIACNNQQNLSDDRSNRSESVDVGEIQKYSDKVNKDSVLGSLTREILTLIKEENYNGLPHFIHPDLGIRFSPYGYVDTLNHVKLTRDQFNLQLEGENKLNWGSYDGTGEDIRLTIGEYFEKFVYDVDFLNAEEVSVNEAIGSGNSLNNLEKVYPGSDYTESYFSGFDEKYSGMDWRSLRLVFQPYKDKYYLVAIVHDQWTI